MNKFFTSVSSIVPRLKKIQPWFRRRETIIKTDFRNSLDRKRVSKLCILNRTLRKTTKICSDKIHVIDNLSKHCLMEYKGNRESNCDEC
ncbi:hypothetical protein HZS_1835 [Henneguya salminicola]|nr:hypothetical protein HZS_1835 [Henneguya salminicola]